MARLVEVARQAANRSGLLIMRNPSLQADPLFHLENIVQAVIDHIGYKFPVDPDREAFDKWYSSAQVAPTGTSELAFQAWKTGRDDLRKCHQGTAESALDEIIPQTAKQPEKNDWKDWSGGERPVGPRVIVQVRYRDMIGETGPAGIFDWRHNIDNQPECDIIAYKITPQTTTP